MKQHSIIRNGEITVPGEQPRRIEILPAREPAAPEPVRIPQPREPEKVPAHGHP